MDTNKKESWAERYVLYTGKCATKWLSICLLIIALVPLISYIKHGAPFSLLFTVFFVILANNNFEDYQFYSIIRRQKNKIKELESKLQQPGANPKDSYEE